MSESRSPLLELTRARILEFVRDPSALFWTFGFPILLAVALGIAFREAPPRPVPIAVQPGPGQAERARALKRDRGLSVRNLTLHEAHRALAAGKVDLVVAPGRGGADVVYLFDPSRPEARTARLAVHDALERARGRRSLVSARDREVREPGSRYIDFLMPGLVGLNIMGSAIWGIGFAVVEARKRRMLKRLAATPMSRADYLLSFMLSRLVFLVLEMAALIGFGRLVFGIALRGSLLSLAIVGIVGALSFTGIALLIAARPKSTEAASGIANLVMLPCWLLGGAFFSYERFPSAFLPFIRALPLTALNDALRSISNEGNSLASTVPQLLVLAAWGLVSFAVALRTFRWQ